jgi:hypothetical protein
MHRLGTHASVHRLDVRGTPSGLLHESYDWAEPPLSVFEPPLIFQPGEGLQLTCEYINTTDRVVRFGPEADAEMCMVWFQYYDL